ncbi:MAG: hypothetical protein WA324_04930 [Bryobacteraceae bacterium]
MAPVVALEEDVEAADVEAPEDASDDPLVPVDAVAAVVEDAEVGLNEKVASDGLTPAA